MMTPEFCVVCVNSVLSWDKKSFGYERSGRVLVLLTAIGKLSLHPEFRTEIKINENRMFEQTADVGAASEYRKDWAFGDGCWIHALVSGHCFCSIPGNWMFSSGNMCIFINTR